MNSSTARKSELSTWRDVWSRLDSPIPTRPSETTWASLAAELHSTPRRRAEKPVAVAQAPAPVPASVTPLRDPLLGWL